MDKPQSDILRLAFQQLKEPVVLKNYLNNEEDKWELLNWTLDELAEKIGDSPLPFRVGFNKKTDVSKNIYNYKLNKYSSVF